MNADQTRGHDLEQQIAGYLRSSGYGVATNVQVKGRSGALHEFDVVGVKGDGLTSYRLVVECKAWSAPIPKEVVYKLSSELSEVGAAKGVIVAAAGWTEQAQQVATHANIDLWGPDELRTLLGPLSWLSPAARDVVEAQGLAFRLATAQAEQAVRRAARGVLGLRGDTVSWVGPAWLPVWSLRVGVTRSEGLLRKVPRTVWVHNDYEAVGGGLVSQWPGPPTLTRIDLAGQALPHLVEAAAVAGQLTRTLEAYREVIARPRPRTEAARAHQASERRASENAVRSVGLQPPVDAVSVDGSFMAYRPLWLGLLDHKRGGRVVAFDGVDGQRMAALERVLTANFQWVVESLRGPQAS